MILDLVGVTDAAEEDGVEGAERLEGVLRHHRAGREVAVAGPVEALGGDLEAEDVGSSIEDLLRLVGDLDPDSVTGDEGDPVRLHVAPPGVPTVDVVDTIDR